MIKGLVILSRQIEHVADSSVDRVREWVENQRTPHLFQSLIKSSERLDEVCIVLVGLRVSWVQFDSFLELRLCTGPVPVVVELDEPERSMCFCQVIV